MINFAFTQASTDLVNILLFIGFLIFAIYQKLYTYIPYPGKSSDGPILMSHGLLNSGSITSLHKGEMQGYKYNLIAAQSDRVMAVVDLGYNTELHFVGLGANTAFDSKALKSKIGSLLRKVDLEGDFPQSFSLYCSRGKEQELLHLFDPADMARFADFCKAYDFELFHDTLYMAHARGGRDENDTTTMIHDLDVFLSKNWRFFKKPMAVNSLSEAK